MTKVFVGGSRRITRLNKRIRDRADEIVKNGHTVLIGDANGADKSMQQFFAARHYDKVTIFCMGNHCRNNLGNWSVKPIRSERVEKDFKYYAEKDLEMTKEATYGFMLWDGKSSGTLNNILSLLEGGKKVYVYVSPKRLFVTLSSAQDLMNLLRTWDRTLLSYFERKVRLSERVYTQEQLSLV